ncbi:MAG: glycosyl transferase group 1 family protein [Planctomycetota bacterium]|nr:glycosyl transferase group 1 family protein [Planctomycetota bacterium]
MRVAVVHDWLCNYAGSERVLEQILAIYPEADLFTVVDFLKAEDRAWLAGRPVRTSFIQRLPFARRWFRLYLPLMPLAVEQLDLGGYDLVISSSHAVAKGVLTTGDQLHVSYVHTPMRYAWDMHHEYLSRPLVSRGIGSALARCVIHYIRFWDQATAHRVDAFVANSRFVARRIRKTYRREVEVIYPPVDTETFFEHSARDDYYLCVSRLVPYKRIDLIVDAFTRTPQRRLVVIGDGPQLAELAERAGPNVTLMGHQPRHVMRDAMQRARAFVFAAQEDFGIAVAEAQACGTPVLCYGKGGATESVIDGQTGVFFTEQTIGSLLDAVERFEAVPDDFDPREIRRNAERFGNDRFREEFEAMITRLWRQFRGESATVRPSGRKRAKTLSTGG